MENTLLSDINKILEKLNIESNDKEEIIAYLIRKVILEKHKISYDLYSKFLFECFGNRDEVIRKNILSEEIKNSNLNNLELTTMCSILDEYLNDEKREQTGSYYTPIYVIKFMVSNSLKAYLEENFEIDTINLSRLIDDEMICNISNLQLHDLLDTLINLKVIDIACGSGLFLYYYFEKIFRIKILILNELKYDYDQYLEKKFIIENNIFGIDIQQAPLEMAALKFIDILADYENFNLNDLKFNLYKTNSVLGDEIYIDLGINKVIDTGGFDIVIGNPPYIGEKGNKDLFERIKKQEFGKKYYEAKMDYFYYFIYRGINILKKRGILSYITTNYFITADGATCLRKFLKDRIVFKNIINFNEYQVFKSAKGQHNIIFTIAKDVNEKKCVNIKYVRNSKLTKDRIVGLINDKETSDDSISSYTLKNQSNLYGENGNIMIFSQKEYFAIVEKIRLSSKLYLGDICNINQGIVSGADKVTKRMIDKKLDKEYMVKNNIDIDKGIFVLTKKEILNYDIENCKLIKPFYKNSDIKKYITQDNADKYILYFTDNNIYCSDYCLAIQKHLKKFKDVLTLRRETQKGTRNWFALQWSREQSIFEEPKIVVPQRSVQNIFGYNECQWYASADVYFITSKNKDIDLKLLLGILNSKIIYFWLYNMGKRKGDYLELYSSPLAQIPIKLNFDENLKQNIIGIVNSILFNCKNNYDNRLIKEYQDRIDSILYKIFQFNIREIEAIEKLYIDKLYSK